MLLERNYHLKARQIIRCWVEWSSPMNNGVLGFGVLIPKALRAVAPLNGELFPGWYLCCAGVPAVEGVPARKRGFAGGGA